MKRIFTALFTVLALLTGTLAPALAIDYPTLTKTGNPLTAITAPFIVLNALSGQSACSVTLGGTFGGTYTVQGLYNTTQQWSANLSTTAPDGTADFTSITTAGNYVFNCANMISIRVDATAGTGSPNITLTATGGVNKVVGTRTKVIGTAPITATTVGNTVTVACPGCGGGGGGGVTTVAAGSNISVTNPTGPTATVNLVNSPSVSGSYTAAGGNGVNVGAYNAPNGYYFAGTEGASNAAVGYSMGASGGLRSYISTCQGSEASPILPTCLVYGVYGSALFYSSQARTYMVTNTLGDISYLGTLHATNLITGTNGELGEVKTLSATIGNLVPTRCLQSGAAGLVTSVTSPCLTSITGGPGIGIVGSGTAAVTVNQTIALNGAAPVTAHVPEVFVGLAIASGATRTYTFSTPFTAANAYGCSALQSATAGVLLGGTTGLRFGTKLAASVQIINDTNVSQSPDVRCDGV